LIGPIGASSAERVNGPGVSHWFTPMREPLRDEILLTGSDWNAFVINNQGVAALHDDHVFVEVMHVWRGQAVSRQVQNAIWLPSAPSRT
jgi:hypothetical protein